MPLSVPILQLLFSLSQYSHCSPVSSDSGSSSPSPFAKTFSESVACLTLTCSFRYLAVKKEERQEEKCWGREIGSDHIS